MIFFWILTVLVTTACTSSVQGDKGEKDGKSGPTIGYAVWPEETAGDELARWYSVFAEQGAELFIEVLEEQIVSRDPLIARMFREARAHGVPARPYIILPYESGLYPNEATFDRFFADVKAFIEWAETEDVPVEWISVDMEPSVQMVLALEAYLSESKLIHAYLLLLSHRNARAFGQSLSRYQTLVDYCHAHGFKVQVVTLPFVLDDDADEDSGLQDAFDLPVSGVTWDEAAFMVYRTMYRDHASFSFTSDLVFRYAVKARQRYGERASIFVGLVLWPGWLGGDSGYQSPHELAEDIQAVLAAGLKRIYVFYLTGVLAKEDPLAWLTVDVADHPVPPQDPFTSLLVDVAMPILDLLF